MLTMLSSEEHSAILTCILALPILAVIALGICAVTSAKYAWVIANLFSLMIVGTSIYLVKIFRTEVTGFQFVTRHALSNSLGISFSLGLDGLGLWCVVFTAIVMAVSVYRAKEITLSICGYLSLLFLLEEAALGIFLTLDLVLYYAFWELMLIPNFLLLYRWGQFQHKKAAMKLALFTALGSLLMLVSIVALAQLTAFEHVSFFIGDLANVNLNQRIGDLILAGFLAAFFLKSAVFPFHSWLPDAHRSAPVGGSFDLALVLPKVGLFGAIRLLILLLPEAIVRHQAELIVLGIIGLFYGALLAWKERDLKRFLAFSTVSHVGLALAGLSSLTVEGLSGCLFLMIGSAIATGALFVIVSEMEKTNGVKKVDELGGLAKSMPICAALFLIFGLSSIGLPLTNGFIAELFSITGIFKVQIIFGFAAVVAIVFSALYFLSVYRQVFFGEEKSSSENVMKDISYPTVLALIPALIIVFIIGLYPQPLLSGVRQASLTIRSSSPYLSKLVPDSFSIGSDSGDVSRLAKSETLLVENSIRSGN